jgi:prolipoprotein diacylglyceryltransferase
MGTALFFLLWALRKRLKVAGTLFAIYLFVNGLERFLIEQIRVNVKMNFAWGPTQAELIAIGLMIGGIILFILLVTKYRTTKKQV